MKERAVQFGIEAGLSGVVTAPIGRASKVGFVLVSAGLVPKVGPYRLYALLARRIAELGVVTLRFDLGGIGDSLKGPGNIPLHARTEQEIKAAVDRLIDEEGVERVVLGGLCSGAEDSFRYAERDPRVHGVVMIDPFSYRTAGFAARHFAHRLARRALRAIDVYEPATSSHRTARLPGGGSLVQYKYIEEPEARQILTRLVDRRVRLHFVYTGGVNETFNHPQQLKKMFPGLDFRGSVSLDHLPGMDHTQLLEEDRDLLVERIATWFAQARD